MYYSKTPLTLDHAASLAPSILAQDHHASRSKQYSYIPTVTILQGLLNEGFNIHGVTEANTRNLSKKGFQKHLIRMRQPEFANSEESPEIVLINSHDGSCSYQLLTGVIRFACANGLIVGDTLEAIKVKHKGDITNNVIDATYEVVKDFSQVSDLIQEMKAIELKPEEQTQLARAAMPLRFEKTEDWKDCPITENQVLMPRRQDDNKNDLWTVFNKIQENLIRGGQRGLTTDKNNRRRFTRTREVKGIDQNVKLNKALWTLTQGMMELKKAA